jgi:hypothetical protein
MYFQTSFFHQWKKKPTREDFLQTGAVSSNRAQTLFFFQKLPANKRFQEVRYFQQ